jgi:hypothetical protein
VSVDWECRAALKVASSKGGFVLHEKSEALLRLEQFQLESVCLVVNT